jgi:hypothetical protein
MNNFKAKGQPEGILTAWKHFQKLGVAATDFGMSTPSREITIRNLIDTAYITWMLKNKTYRVTLYGSASTKPERRKLAKEYPNIEDAISTTESALGY